MTAGDIKKKISKVIAQINERNPYYLVIGVLLVVLILDYVLIMQFQLAVMRRMGPRISAVKDDFKQFETNFGRVDKYRQDIKDLDQDLAALDQQIKTIDEIPIILEGFSRAANRNKVFIEQLVPNSDLGKPELNALEGNYYMLSVQIDAKSSYHNLGRFLSDLEQKGALMRVEGLSIAKNPVNPHQHNIKMQVRVVVFEPKINEAKK